MFLVLGAIHRMDRFAHLAKPDEMEYPFHSWNFHGTERTAWEKDH